LVFRPPSDIREGGLGLLRCRVLQIFTVGMEVQTVPPGVVCVMATQHGDLLSTPSDSSICVFVLNVWHSSLTMMKPTQRTTKPQDVT